MSKPKHTRYVEAGPFLAIIEERAQKFGSAASTIAHVHDCTPQRAAHYALYRRFTHRHDASERERMEFKTADLIVTRLLGAHAWYERTELSAIYESVS